ncbi:MAG TPA: hypothetical protein P5096_01795 [Patescibacteria group bacterium]|nr:hypothetical protein [Patescibacteria group bacterium]
MCQQCPKEKREGCSFLLDAETSNLAAGGIDFCLAEHEMKNVRKRAVA